MHYEEIKTNQISKKKGTKNQTRRQNQTKKKRAGYFFDYRFPKVNGDMRSCIQDAVLNAATQLGIEIDQEEFKKKCPPRKTIDASIGNVIKEAGKYMHITKDGGDICNMLGGPEANLVASTDGKLRVVHATIQAKNNEITEHAFCHCAYKLKERKDQEHVGAIIDNRKKAPICLIEEHDVQDLDGARRVMTNFFGGEGTRVRVKTVYVVEPLKKKN